MKHFESHLRWIESQHDVMCDAVERYAAINTHSFNARGLHAFAEVMRTDLKPLELQVVMHELPPYEYVDDAGERRSVALGPALSMRSPPREGPHVFLGIHYDTVYADGTGPTLQREERVLRGPGVMDAKGGLVVMLFALQALEQSPFAQGMNWEFLLNPDEEIGSPGSAVLLDAAGRRNEVGLVYEPALPDGALVGERKGSGNFSLVMRGRAAHAGRDFAAGRNAVAALASVVGDLDRLNQEIFGITLNVGMFRGGTAVNIVPDLAICRFNVRFDTTEQQEAVESALRQILGNRRMPEGFELQLQGGMHCPPKPMDEATQLLLHELRDCGEVLGLDLRWRSTGGVCDGNRLAAAGLPTVDSLGVRGGGAHTVDEFMEIDSLVERAKLSAMMLMRIGSGEFQWRRERRSTVEVSGS